MKGYSIVLILFLINVCVFAQPNQQLPASGPKQHSSPKNPEDSLKRKIEAGLKRKSIHRKMIMATDTLTTSDYMISIERVNDNLNDIRDSIKLGFEIVRMERRCNEITNDIKIIRQNIRDKHSVVNMKNLYLYQSFASNLDDETDRTQLHLSRLYKKVYHSKLRLKTVLTDSIFHKLFTDSSLVKSFDTKLLHLERKWGRTDSTTKANIDSLNFLKVKISDNGINLSNMLNMMDSRLDKAGDQLIAKEVNFLWQKDPEDTLSRVSSTMALSLLGSEQKAIGYYFSQTSSERAIVMVFGILLFIWLFFKRKLLKKLKEQKASFEHLHFQYLNSYPVLSLFVLLLSLMPFFDAYAPVSYIAIEYVLLLIFSSFVFYIKTSRKFFTNWIILMVLFILDIITNLVIEPSILTRLWLLMIHVLIIIFAVRIYLNLDRKTNFYKWIKRATLVGIILTCMGIICNVFGRFSLAGIFGLAGIIAITQALILPVFIETFIEIILLQLQASRLKKGVDRPFDSNLVIKKVKTPVIIISLILWLIMLASNLNIYHNLSNYIVEALTVTRTIGSISYKLISILLFFIIIWVAHILQRFVSFLFGETGSEAEDMSAVSKGQHSRLLITRLLVLIGGYLLAIAASGLPIDKLTFLLGALGVGIGMGLQNVVNNFVSGIILIFDGSLQIGDEIEANDQSGKVKEIGLRASTLITSDGAEVIIPNGNLLSQNIVNWTFSSDQKRVMLEFKLTGKELDANMINDLINNTVNKIPHVNTKRKPVILFIKVTQESCSLLVRFWCTISNADQVKSETLLQLNTAFNAKNIGFE